MQSLGPFQALADEFQIALGGCDATFRFLLEHVLHIDLRRESHRINCAVGVASVILDQLQYAGAAKSLERFGVGRRLTELDGKQRDISRNADFDARAGEKAIFEADEKIYNAFTARASAQPSTQCIYGNGIIRVTDPGRVTGTKRKGRGNPALPVSAGSLGLAVPTTTEAASTLV